MRIRTIVGSVALLLLMLTQAAPSTAGQPTILALGNTGFLDPASGSSVEVVRELRGDGLRGIAAILAADIPFAALPAAVQQGLEAFVQRGGAFCLTGGPRAFGSGGYQAVAPLLPFELRSTSDWRAIPFRPPVVLQTGHPLVSGVSFTTIGGVNDMNPRRGATEILQAAGGGTAGGGSYPYPLMAELRVGAGRVLGIAFDLNDLAGMRDRARFVQNLLAYLAVPH